MKKKLIFLIGLTTSLMVVSCYPPANPQPVTPPKPVADENKEDSTAGVDPDTLSEFEEWRRQQGLTDEPGGDRSVTGPQETNPGQVNVPGGGPKPVDPKPADREEVKPPQGGEKKNHPFAVPVPGRPGFVFNPYNQKKVDVRGFPSGSLVSDPRNPNQKFYVP